MSAGILFFLFFLMAVVVHRVTHFICYDTLIEEQREKFLVWLRLPTKPLKRKIYFDVRKKVAVLIECPWCVSIYVSAGALILHRLTAFVFETLPTLPMPVWWWVGLSSAACILMEYTEGEKSVAVRQITKRNE